MKNTMDGDASLLDKIDDLWGSPMADPNIHNHRRCPMALFGKPNGQLQGGVHLKAADGTPMANVMLRCCTTSAWTTSTAFGDSTGEFSWTVPSTTTAA